MTCDALTIKHHIVLQEFNRIVFLVNFINILVTFNTYTNVVSLDVMYS